MTRIAKHPTKISDLDGQMYEEFQRRLREREFCIGWHPIDSQKKTYYEALFDSWHEANQIAGGMQKDHPEMVFFVETATVTKKCSRCKGSGVDPLSETGLHGECGHCHGKGRVRA